MQFDTPITARARRLLASSIKSELLGDTFEMMRKVKVLSREGLTCLFCSVRFFEAENARRCLICSLASCGLRNKDNTQENSNSPRWIMNEVLCEGGREDGSAVASDTCAGSHTGACRRRAGRPADRRPSSSLGRLFLLLLPPSLSATSFFSNSPYRRIS